MFSEIEVDACVCVCVQLKTCAVGLSPSEVQQGCVCRELSAPTYMESPTHAGRSYTAFAQPHNLFASPPQPAL